MDQSKFSLADLFTLLTALLFGFVCFLGGVNFFSLGSTNQSITSATIITVLLGGTAFCAKLLKRTSRKFKTCFVGEMILLFLFTSLFVLFSYSPFPHYFNVLTKRTEIQDKLSVSITQAENMFAAYEQYANNRENLYKSRLRSVAAAQHINPNQYVICGFENNGVSHNRQIENKIFILHADLFPSNYEAMKQIDSTWLTEAQNIVAGWKPIRIVDVVNEVEQNTKDWLKKLIQLSIVREKGEQASTSNFAYDLSFDDVKVYFTTLDKPTPLTIGVAALAYLLMLLSWLVTKRHPRFPGLKYLFGKGGTLDNEL